MMSLRFRSSARAFSPAWRVPVDSTSRSSSWVESTICATSRIQVDESAGVIVLNTVRLTALTNPLPSFAIQLFLKARP